jgi:hypothetical protein
MGSAGKEGVWRAELTAAQKAYKQIVAKEERMKRRIAARDIAMEKSMRALLEAKMRLTRKEEHKKGRMDPIAATVSLINKAMREIKEARDS